MITPLIPSTHKHLVNSIKGDLTEVREELKKTHKFLVERCENGLPERSGHDTYWGIKMKRIEVDLLGDERPALIGKNKERLSEVVNILATIERLRDALEWFEENSDFGNLQVAVCNPSTSSSKTKEDVDNDLILCDDEGKHIVLCEVCDVASSRAGQNSKEKSELKSLGCEAKVPPDGKSRFICTSTQFAKALMSELRTDKHYRYKDKNPRENKDSDDTTILQVLSA